MTTGVGGPRVVDVRNNPTARQGRGSRFPGFAERRPSAQAVDAFLAATAPGMPGHITDRTHHGRLSKSTFMRKFFLLSLVTVTLIGASCGSSSGSHPATESTPTTATPSPPTTSAGSVTTQSASVPSSSVTSPEPASTATPSATAGGQSFSGHAGVVETFSLPAGSYVIDVYAQYDPTYDASGSGQCFFSGAFDNLTTGSHAALGGAAPLVQGVPLANTVNGSLGAGNYQLTIFPTTNCDWRFTVVPAG